MMYQTNIICNYKIKRDFDSLNNKETSTLFINCETCQFFHHNTNNKFLHKNCYKNFVKLFINNKNLTNVIIETINGEFELTTTQIELITDYVLQLIRCSNVKIPEFNERDGCVKKDDCKDKLAYFIERIMGSKFNDALIISNPILTYIEINQETKIYNQLITKKNKCRICYEPFLRFLRNIQDLLHQTKIIERYFLLDNKNRTLSEIFTSIFGDYNLNSDFTKFNSTLSEFRDHICMSYKKGPYKIKIAENPDSRNCIYMISSIIDDPTIKNIYTIIMQKIKSQPKKYFDYRKPHKLNFLLQFEKKFVIQLIEQNYGHLSDEQISDLAELIIFELINLNPLMAFLIDDEIEEIFVDSPNSFIYIDHRQFGRCQTSISMTPTGIESFKTRIRMESEQRLDETQPFLKTEVITKYFHIRVSLQIHPLSIDGFSMSIRKLHKKTLTLIDLIENNTLNIEAASYLIFNLIHGRCILVIGEPYSGKTTLINSLDMVGKRSWRKVYIEDVIESIDQSAFEVHQVRFQVNISRTDSEKYSTKAFQVKECLHRTPDVIFIGELIHQKSVESYFFLLKVGLRRCLATAHGESPELIVERFFYDDQIPFPLIGNLDIIVQMNRIHKDGRIIRRVTRITEIKKESNINLNQQSETFQGPLPINFIDIFLRDPEIDQLTGSYNLLNELYLKSDIIKKINLLRGVYISEIDFITEIEKIKSVLNELLKSTNREMGDIIKIFHRFWTDIEINIHSNGVSNLLSVD